MDYAINCNKFVPIKNGIGNTQKGVNPGLVVMGGDLHSRGRGLKSLHRILDGHLLHYVVAKMYCFYKKTINEKEAGNGLFFLKKEWNNSKFA